MLACGLLAAVVCCSAPAAGYVLPSGSYRAAVRQARRSAAVLAADGGTAPDLFVFGLGYTGLAVAR